MEADLIINQHLTIPGHELWVTHSRSTGPGGQNVNKTSTRVSLHWSCLCTSILNGVERARLKRRLGSRISLEGVLAVHVDETRSQIQNREIARDRMKELVRWALQREKARIPTKPKPQARLRRLEEKRRLGLRKKLRRTPKLNE